MNHSAPTTTVVIKHFHFFCGLGAAAKGMNKGHARVGSLRAEFRCIGGIDNNPGAIRDFGRLAGVPGTVLDLFDYEQYLAFHGKEPPAGWRPAMPDDIRAAAHGERPNIIFLSAPCKGFSGLLPETSSKTPKYQALNRLTLRGVWLALETWKDDPPELFVFENVPRIAKRGRHLLDQICALFRAYGYAVAETAHDCGEIGKLAQSRKRFLLVARHEAKVPPFLYEPEKHRLLGVGEVLEKFPLPGHPAGGPMHRVPSLQWRTWIRLAFVEAGADWRSLNRLNIENGFLRDFGIMPTAGWHDDVLGVLPWQSTSGTIPGRSHATNGRYNIADPRQFEDPHNGSYGVAAWPDSAGTITANGRPAAGTFSVADPRFEGLEYSQYGVRHWDDSTGAVINVKSPGQGYFSVADPRMDGKGPRFNNVYRVVAWPEPANTVTGGGHPSSGGLAVADPRSGGSFEGSGKYRVTDFSEAAGTIIAASDTGQGAFALADPRMNWRDDAHPSKLAVSDWDDHTNAITGARFLSGAGAVADPRPGYRPGAHQNILSVAEWDDSAKCVTGADHVTGGALCVADPRPVGLNAKREHYQTGGHYGVLPWNDSANAVPGFAKHDRGPWSVADPRPAEGDATFELPKADDRLVAVIRALDGTWHRPFTILELAALQSLVDPDEMFTLDGQSESAWRERIGNAVPPAAAEAIAGVMATTLLLAMTGETFTLSSQPIWVRPIAVALSVDQRGNIPNE
ncbi:DNA cytosine methyltransferase [Rhizobium sp. 18065]|uniref:DNA cytosine methyltransferase n=1 Tax=Rhizobium sp. 18065 TaxID=2681411 RepID=UPI001359D673|nr:DNA cytosine methyltransferase [Rhizobium sp. 18065]